MENENIVGPRGKRLLYSRFFSGGISKDDAKHLEEFKTNCSRKNSHMNYDGKKKDCGWSILLKRNNKIEKVLIPIAEASGFDVDIFIDEMIDQFLKNISRECIKNDPVKEISIFRKDTISKIVPDIIEIKK